MSRSLQLNEFLEGLAIYRGIKHVPKVLHHTENMKDAFGFGTEDFIHEFSYEMMDYLVENLDVNLEILVEQSDIRAGDDGVDHDVRVDRWHELANSGTTAVTAEEFLIIPEPISSKPITFESIKRRFNRQLKWWEYKCFEVMSNSHSTKALAFLDDRQSWIYKQHTTDIYYLAYNKNDVYKHHKNVYGRNDKHKSPRVYMQQNIKRVTNEELLDNKLGTLIILIKPKIVAALFMYANTAYYAYNREQLRNYLDKIFPKYEKDIMQDIEIYSTGTHGYGKKVIDLTWGNND